VGLSASGGRAKGAASPSALRKRISPRGVSEIANRTRKRGPHLAKALVITEKPSVARDITQALGGFTEHDDGAYWESDDHVVSFAVGHLFELLPPEEVDERFKRWTLADLPIIPETFGLKKKKGQSDRIRTLQKLLERDDVDRVINACDAGREGELIFREIIKYLGCEKPIERLWLQSMTQSAIVTGFESLRPDEQLHGLAAAAECRAYSDWLIGMNATRALTKRLKSRRERTAWSAGRVQTPTLAILVDREAEVLAHAPRPYWRVVARLQHDADEYEATWFDPGFEAGEDGEARDDRIFDEARARAIVQAVSGRTGSASETRKPSRETAPPLFDLTSLQREGNRRFSWSARRTLSAAQRCYEAHKLLTYPRTDSRCLPNDYRDTVQTVLRSLASIAEASPGGEFAVHAQRLLDDGLQNTERTFDDSKVSDHFAIIPTGQAPPAHLSGDDKRLFDLVMRRFLGSFHPAAVWERVERISEVESESFRTRARALVEPGWRAVLPASADEEEPTTLPALVAGSDDASGVPVSVQNVESSAEETKPPARYTEARLLSLMENAGKAVDDENIAAALHEKGLGTPATRAEVIENLIAKGYAVRVGKGLRPTVKGIRLIDTLKRVNIARLASPALTGEIELHLNEVELGRRPAEDFINEMKDYAREIVEIARTFEYDEIYGGLPALGPCPSCGRDVYEQTWFFRCEEEPARDPDCPMRFWKDTSGRYMDRGTIQTLLRDGMTGTLDGFTARNGRTYKGHLEIDRDEWKVLVRSEGWNEDGTNDQPDYDVNPDPLGRCPICDEQDVVESPTQFICAGRLKIEEEADREEEEARKTDDAPRRKAARAARKEACPFVLPRTVCKREIERSEALVYLKGGRTDLLTDFTSRFGRPFSATLFLKENGRHGFEFPPRASAARGEGEAAPAEKGGRKKAPAKGKDAKAPKKKAPKKKGPRKKAAARPARKKAASGTRKTAARKKAGANKKSGASGRTASEKPQDT
jgi:DNA topoisomerase-3